MIDKVFIVHYTKLKERKSNILSYINKFNTPYSFIEDYDQEVLNQDILSKFYLPEKIHWDNKVSPIWDVLTHSFRHLNIAEISCTIKHLLAVKRVAEECTTAGLILEDDCMPISENFYEQMLELIRKLPSDWDVIFFGEGCGNAFIDRNISSRNLERKDGYCKAVHPATNCAEAYLVKANVAEKLYKESLPFQLVSDWELASSFYKLNLNIYWAVPPIFNQGSKNGTFDSTLR